MQSDKVKITVQLEGIRDFLVEIDPSRKREVLKAQETVNSMVKSWSAANSSWTPLEVMGRVAFRLAQVYEQLNKVDENLRSLLESSQQELDKIILGMKP